jgi:putative ABC transport system permease protein
VTEQVLLSSLAMAVGMLFLIQLPFTGIFAKFMDWNSFFVSAGIAMAIIYVVSIICALYPAWMASRMSPTDALHYE